MIDDYISAKRSGDGAYRMAVISGQYPYLMALDDLVSSDAISTENRLGVMEIPIASIAGTKTAGRQRSFARNFMPILNPRTEFAGKWSSLYDSSLHDGIRDPILAYEYMGRFYVQEGNKRVSVSKYNGAVSILANVIRLVPTRTGSKENNIYFEFVDFFKVSGLYGINFSEEGQYRKLCDALQLSFTVPWSQDQRRDVKAAFERFCEAFHKRGGERLGMTDGDAFLIYLNIYGKKNLLSVANSVIEQNLQKSWNEYLNIERDVQLVENPDALKKSTGFLEIFNTQDPPYSDRPLKVAFLYDKDLETSSWSYGHELGRNYINSVFPERVITEKFENCIDDTATGLAIDQAVKDGCELIFTTSGGMVEASVKAAIRYPKLRILNCSVNSSYNSIRTYYGRMYEAKFLMGALAASVTEGNDIGYVELCPQYGTIANVNAFAIGASLINPYVRIHLKWSALEGHDWRQELRDEHVVTISGPELTAPNKISREFGVYMVLDGDVLSNVATPVFDWGKFYEIIIRSVFDGSFDTASSRLSRSHEALNFWFGMSSGVIDVIMSSQLNYPSRKMMDMLRNGVVSGRINPFDGELRCQTGIIKGRDSGRLTNEEIVSMRWLNDNVIGEIPPLQAFHSGARELIRMSGLITDQRYGAET